MLPFEVTRELVRDILRHSERRWWTLQGFGMLRTYITKAIRLHVWSGDHMVPDVTLLHDHPWDFKSTILSGCIVNHLWVPTTPKAPGAERFMCSTIVCGPNPTCGPSEPEPVWLRRTEGQVLRTGEHYYQERLDVHSTGYADGTVSLIERRFHDDTEHARVFYRDRWVSAEPRDATPEEVRAITDAALERWEAL